MKVKSVVTLKVIDLCCEDYSYDFKDENGKEVNRSGRNFFATVKYEGGVAQNLKVEESVYNQLAVGSDNQFIFEFETEPSAYIGKNDGKAKVNFNHVPKIVGLVPSVKK